MGAIQKFQWMVAYPEIMDDAIPMLGAPRLAPYSLLHLKLGMDLLMKDPAWKNGNYVAPLSATTSMELADLVLTTPEYFDAHTSRDQVFEQINHLDGSGVVSHVQDANDKIRTTQAPLKFDVSMRFGGSVADAASSVHAKTLIVVSKTGPHSQPRPCTRTCKTHA